MRTLLAALLAFLPLFQEQDSRPLKSVEPRYDRFNEDLATDFNLANASVTLTVMANGKPLAVEYSSAPLPMAVVMALKEYEFQPQGAVPHGRPDAAAGAYQVSLNVPIRQRKESAVPQSLIRVRPGISKGLLRERVQPEYPEFAKSNRIKGRVLLEALISKQGYAARLQPIFGPFVLIEAAYEAVRQWEYRPYLLNREPVEMLTEIEIVFN